MHVTFSPGDRLLSVRSLVAICNKKNFSRIRSSYYVIKKLLFLEPFRIFIWILNVILEIQINKQIKGDSQICYNNIKSKILFQKYHLFSLSKTLHHFSSLILSFLQEWDVGFMHYGWFNSNLEFYGLLVIQIRLGLECLLGFLFFFI